MSTLTSTPIARSAAGNAPQTSPRPPVFVSGAHSGATNSTLREEGSEDRSIKKDPGRGPGSDAYIRPKGGRCVCKGGKRGGLSARGRVRNLRRAGLRHPRLKASARCGWSRGKGDYPALAAEILANGNL